jgi:hypothetical protein
MRPTLQLEYEPLTADDLDLLGSWERTGRRLTYLEARSLVRVGRLQRHLNGLLSIAKLDVDGRLGPLTIRRMVLAEGDLGPIRLDGETRWYVDRYVHYHPASP